MLTPQEEIREWSAVNEMAGLMSEQGSYEGFPAILAVRAAAGDELLIVDGHHRWAACRKADVDPTVTVIDEAAWLELKAEIGDEMQAAAVAQMLAGRDDAAVAATYEWTATMQSSFERRAV